jgi:hypothetical protein
VGEKEFEPKLIFFIKSQKSPLCPGRLFLRAQNIVIHDRSKQERVRNAHEAANGAIEELRQHGRPLSDELRKVDL